MSNKKGILALSPLIVFVVIYLATSIIANDFYKVPLTVAFMPFMPRPGNRNNNNRSGQSGQGGQGGNAAPPRQ